MKQIDQLIDWNSTEKAIAIHYSPLSDSAAGPLTRDCRGLSDESVEDMANSNLHVMRFLGLSCFQNAVNVGGSVGHGLLEEINRQI